MLEELVSNNYCFESYLRVLKESSLEAVESSNTFSDFKKYMHVEREVQIEFENTIKQVAHIDGAQLILLCGSVGDGKSHMLSYFNDNKSELMSCFNIHNDATASFYIDKPALETLNEVLDDFSDEKLSSSNYKLILAINLGTLTNFMESQYKDRFSFLRDFVEEKGILESKLRTNNYDGNSHFHYINFSDYHLYTLKDGTARSEYLIKLLSKVTENNPDNWFYSKYKKCCLLCENSMKCPIKANYEILNNQDVQESLCQLIIEAIVKSKVIISTRGLLNFIYEIIVDLRYIDTSSSLPKASISNMNDIEYVKSLLPNIIFSNDESSNIFSATSMLDPLDIRNDIVDELFIGFYNDEDLLNKFDDFLSIYPYLEKFTNYNFEENSRLPLKKVLLMLYIRTCRLTKTKGEQFGLIDINYCNFINDLYNWNKGKKMKLKKLYDDIKSSALQWNGNTPENMIGIPLGKHQTEFRISQNIEIRQNLSDITTIAQEELISFSDNITLKYENFNKGKTFKIEVDYSLYSLLYKILKGYLPNRKDKNLNIKFNSFINQLENVGSMDEYMIFTEKNRENNKKYKLEYNDDFGYTFMEN